jgi:hypothetical protein
MFDITKNFSLCLVLDGMLISVHHSKHVYNIIIIYFFVDLVSLYCLFCPGTCTPQASVSGELWTTNTTAV